MKKFKLFLTLVMCFGMALSIEAQSFYLKTAKGNYISCNESGVLTNGTTKQEWNVSFEGIKAYVSTTVSGKTLYLKLDENQIVTSSGKITSKFIGSTTKTEIYLFDGSKGSANVDLMTSVAGDESRYLVSPKITVSTTDYCGYYIFRHDYSASNTIDAKLMVIDIENNKSDSYEIYSDPITSNTKINISTNSSANDNTRLIFEAVPTVQYAQVKLGDYDTTKGTASITGVTLNETFNSGTATSNATKELTLTATPKEGYKLKGWKLNGSDITVTNNSYTLTYFGTEEKPGVYEFTPVFAEKGKLAGTPYYITYGSTNYIYTSGTGTPSIKGGTTKQTWGIAAKDGQFQIQTLSNETAYNMCLTSSALSLNTDESSYTAYLYYTSNNQTATKATSTSIDTSNSYIIVFKNSSGTYYMLKTGQTPSLTQIYKSSSSSNYPKWSGNAGSSSITLSKSTTTAYNVKFVEAPSFFGKVTANATTGGKVLVDANSTASTGFGSSSEQTWGAMKNTEIKTWYFHAQATSGYEFMAWAEDAAGKKAVSKEANFQVKVTATSDDENNPTAKQYYAIFRKTATAEELGSNLFYISNGDNYLSGKTDDETISLGTTEQAWKFGSYNTNNKGFEMSINSTSRYMRCEQAGDGKGVYVFNTSGSNQKYVMIFDKDGNLVTSQNGLVDGNYYYFVYKINSTYYLMSNESYSYEYTKNSTKYSCTALKTTTVNVSTSGSTTMTKPSNASNYQFTLSKGISPKTVEVTVSSAGYATYCSDKDLVVPADETVFGAKSKDDVVSLIPVDKDDVIKAGEGIIIKKIGGGTVTFNISKEAGVAIAENELKGTTEYEKFTLESIYLLGVNDGNAAFMLNKGSYLLAPNKAYLSKPANAKQILYISEDTDDATAINSVSENLSNAKMYNLNGIQVNKNYKGIVIKDGKKYLMK